MILRLAVSTFLIHDSFTSLTGPGKATHVLLTIAAAGAGALLFAGLWTPVAGVLVALLELWIALSTPGEFWPCVLSSAIALALSLVGPGAWSVDAVAYGRKRIF